MILPINYTYDYHFQLFKARFFKHSHEQPYPYIVSQTWDNIGMDIDMDPKYQLHMWHQISNRGEEDLPCQYKFPKISCRILLIIVNYSDKTSTV